MSARPGTGATGSAGWATHGGTQAPRSPTVAIVGDPTSMSDRYLSLQDRLVIADGLINGLNQSQIAAAIGKDKSTVSREVRTHRVEGLYLPYQAERAAAADRARPKQSKLV